MKLLQRLKFAWKYDISPEFIVVPFGQESFSASRFLKYEDAEAFCWGEYHGKPQFGLPGILVRVTDLKLTNPDTKKKGNSKSKGTL